MQLTMDCSMLQEQKQEMNLRQMMLVRCVVVYLDGVPTYVPIDPKVSTRTASRTGYAVHTDVPVDEATAGSMAAAVAHLAGTFPKDLFGIVHFI